ncbi:MAG: putative immunity protein [Nitratireductor sp.]
MEAGPRGFTRSIEELDDLDLCGFYDEDIRPVLLEMTGGSTSKRFAFSEILSSAPNPQKIRQWLTPVARIAQDDPRVHERLTGFINDCAIKALPRFEEDFPGDQRPREAIEATREFMAGKLDQDGWSPICKESLAAWAGWFAPKGFYASAEWAAVKNSSWHYPRVRNTSWSGWAEWASLTLLAYLGHNYRLREHQDELDEDNQTEHEWAFERLGLWLEDAPPLPMKLPEKPAGVSVRGGAAQCRAEFVTGYDMEWPTIAAYPTGLKKIGSVSLDRNAGMIVPEGVVSILQIGMSDHPLLSLPDSLRKVGTVRVMYDGLLELPEGVEEVESIFVYSESVVHLPNSVRHVGTLDADAEVVAEDNEEGAQFWASIDEQERNGVKEYGLPFYDAFVIWKDRCFIRKRKNLTSDNL